MENIEEVFLEVYPVGSVYITANPYFFPSEGFGGTWERFGKGKALFGIDEGDSDFGIAELTGGAKEHVLTVDEMPMHRHQLDGYGHHDVDGGGGTEGMSSNDHGAEPYTKNVGGNRPHNNLPPYIAVYFWKRLK